MNPYAAILQGILSEAGSGTYSCHAEDGLLPCSGYPVRMLRYPTCAQVSDVVSAWKYVSEVLSDVVRNAKNIIAADSSAPVHRGGIALIEQTSDSDLQLLYFARLTWRVVERI